MAEQPLVPDVVDSCPTNRIQVSYPSGVTVNFGNELTPTQVKDEPKVEWSAESGDLYTLCMTDPDVPFDGEFNHWLVINITGQDLASGQTLAAYGGSGPPKGTGLHRYVFLVYKQQTSIETSEKTADKHTIDGRRGFRIRDFAKEHNLGQPIAANYYRAQYDDYVPILHAQFGFKG